MGKVQIIEKSRKAYRCNKCGNDIPVGSKYFRGEINFGPTIIRCNNCKLQPWEVTTSDYVLQIGPIVYDWEEIYGVGDDTASRIAEELQSIADELQERYDNMPEGFQDGDIGQLLESRIDSLENAISDLEDIDTDDIKSAAFEEYCTGVDLRLFDDFDSALSYFDDPNTAQGAEEAEQLIDLYESTLNDLIESALGEIDF